MHQDAVGVVRSSSSLATRSRARIAKAKGGWSTQFRYSKPLRSCWARQISQRGLCVPLGAPSGLFSANWLALEQGRPVLMVDLHGHLKGALAVARHHRFRHGFEFQILAEQVR